MGSVALRCSNCGMSPLALFRISTWFALFFIPVIPLSFKHTTSCPNCKRVEYVTKAQVDAAHEARSQAPGQPIQAMNLETPSVGNDWRRSVRLVPAAGYEATAGVLACALFGRRILIKVLQQSHTFLIPARFS